MHKSLRLCLLVLSFSVALHAQFPTNGLVAYYPLHGTAIDSSGNGNNGTLNSVVFVPDRFGNANGAASFTKANSSHIQIPTFTPLSNENLTISCWIEKPAPTYSNFETIIGTNRFRFDACRDTQITWAWTLRAGADLWSNWFNPTVWHHIVGIKKGDTLLSYIDTVQSISVTGICYDSTSSVTAMNIGCDGLSGLGSTDYYAGYINDIRIYDTILSYSQICALFHEGGWPLTLSAPLLASPTNGTLNVPINTMLAWNSVSGAASYRVQLSNTSLFSLVSDTTLSATSRTVSALTANSLYYWRVYATNSSGSSAWSSVWSFNTVAAPAAPSLASPSAGSTGQAIALTLSWNTSANAVSYAVQVSTVSTFGSTISSFSGLSAVSQAISILNYGSTYYWCVNATNSAGTIPWSNIWSFTTIGTPAVPVLFSPTNGTTNVSINTLLSWNTVSGATSYNVQLSNTSSFALMKDTSLALAYWPMLSLSNGSPYYWEVNAMNSAGTSAWSGIWSFLVGPSAVLPQKDAPDSKRISFSNSGIIYELPTTSNVSLIFYNIQGRQVKQLVSGMQNAGLYSINFNHAKVPAGYYIVEFKAGTFIVQKRLALMN